VKNNRVESGSYMQYYSKLGNLLFLGHLRFCSEEYKQLKHHIVMVFIVFCVMFSIAVLNAMVL